MLIQLPDAPYAVRVLPWIPYRTAPATTRDEQIGLSLDFLLPDPLPPHPVPAILHFHGGAWEVGDKSSGMYPWASPLIAAHGFVAVNVQYRLSWMAAHPAQVDDARAAVHWIRRNATTYGIDPGRIGVWGHSAGGHLAAMLGTDEPSSVQAVIAQSAVLDLRPPPGHDIDQDYIIERLVGGKPSQHIDALHDLSPTARVHAGMPPFLVVHGNADEQVSFDAARQFVEQLTTQGVDVTFDVVDGGHHDLRLADDPHQNTSAEVARGHQTIEFFAKHLGSPRVSKPS